MSDQRPTDSGAAVPRRRRVLIGALLAIAASLIAAGVAVAMTASSVDEPVVSDDSTAHTVGPTEPTVSVPVDDVSRDDLSHEYVASWTGYEVVSDHQLRFSFLSGTEECYGTRVQVTETAETIGVTIYVGVLPDAEDGCIDIARFATVLVNTDTPIGGRQIVDPTAVIS